MSEGCGANARTSLTLKAWGIWSMSASYKTESDSTSSTIGTAIIIVSTNLSTISHLYSLMINEEIPESHKTYSSDRQNRCATEDITYIVGPIGE